MDEALQQAIAMLDESAAIITELVAQVRSNGKTDDITKKAESFAVKMGVSFEEASDMMKEAEAKGVNADDLIKTASIIAHKTNAGFSKLTNDENKGSLAKTAMERYLEAEAEIESSL